MSNFEKMKKYISILGLAFCFTSIQAQTINDALRYSQTNPLGTARFRAMSGAFGALGGDLSAISANPASSVVFANNQVGFTLSNYNLKNDANYFGTNNFDSFNSFEVNQAGGVFVFENSRENSDWKKFAVAINYENQNNFDDSVYFSGYNPTNSIDDYFLYYANANEKWNGIKQGTLQNAYFGDLPFEDQQAYLGYNAYIIDPIPLASDPTNYDNPNIDSYSSAILGGGAFFHKNSVETTGYNGKLTFNGSAQYQDKLMIGLSLNSHFSDYRKISSFFESNANNTSTDYYVKRVYFNNELHTFGNGFSFQLGAIFKINNVFRIGGAYESPTWHKLTDETTQSVSAVSANNTDELAPDIANPETTMIWEPYTLQTPGKLTGSAAFVFGKKGLISIDYSIKDYSTTRFKITDEFNDTYNKIKDTNDGMKNMLTTANELRIGGEHKIKQWSLRAGYRFETSPYKDENIMGDLTGYSGGIGYNFGRTKLDFAYSTAKRTYGEQLFSQGLTDRASIKTKNDNLTLTVSFEL